MAIDFDCSCSTTISTMRCWSAWKEPIGTPNCLRVSKQSSVTALSVSMMPTASAPSAAMVRKVLMRGKRSLASLRLHDCDRALDRVFDP